MRRGELLGLMYSDIDFAAQTHSVNRSLADVRGVGVVINPPKKGSYRINPLSQAAIDILSAIPRRWLYVYSRAAKTGCRAPMRGQNAFLCSWPRCMRCVRTCPY